MAKNFNLTPGQLMNAGAPTAGTQLRRQPVVELLYDYDGIEGITQETREKLMADAIEIKRAEGTINEKVWMIGHLLTDIKEQLPYGEWLKWLARETPYGPEAAAKMMNYARNFQDPARFDGLSMSAVLLLTSNSTPASVVDGVATQIETGKPPTYKEIKSMISNAKRDAGGYDNDDDLLPLNTDLPPIISPTTQRMQDEAAARAMLREYQQPDEPEKTISVGAYTRSPSAPVTRTPMRDDGEYHFAADDDPTVVFYEYISALRAAISAARNLEAADPTGMYINGRDVTGMIGYAQALIGQAERYIDQ